LGHLIIRTLYIDLSKDVKICAYFSKPKRGPRTKNIWGKLVYFNEINQCRLNITYSFQFLKQSLYQHVFGSALSKLFFSMTKQMAWD